MGKVPKHIDVRETRKRESARGEKARDLAQVAIGLCTLAIGLAALVLQLL